MLINSAWAQSGNQPPPGGDLFSLGFLVLMFVLFYVIAIRPQRKRQKEHEAMVSALAKGDEVVTNGGVMGKIVKVEDNLVLVEVAENVNLKFQKNAVHAVLPKGTLKAI